jgi:hypothetical protein
LCSSSPSGDSGALRIKSRKTYAPSLAVASMFPHCSTVSRISSCIWVYIVLIKVSERASFSHVKAGRQDAPRSPWMLLPTRSTTTDIAQLLSSLLPLSSTITCAALSKCSQDGKRSSRAPGPPGRFKRPRQGEQVPTSHRFMAEYALLPVLILLSFLLIPRQALILALSSRPSTQLPRTLSPTNVTLWYNERNWHKRPKTFANSKIQQS